MLNVQLNFGVDEWKEEIYKSWCEKKKKNKDKDKDKEIEKSKEG